MKRRIFILLSLLVIILTSCSHNLNNNYSNNYNNPWVGNWYGYVGESFYKLRLTDNYAYFSYTTDNGGYRQLYKEEIYEYTSKSFTVTFKKFNDGRLLDKNMEIYGTMISGRDDGFLLWNSTDRPFFRLD